MGAAAASPDTLQRRSRLTAPLCGSPRGCLGAMAGRRGGGRQTAGEGWVPSATHGLPKAAVPLCIALQQAAGLASVLEEVIGHAADGAHILVAGGSPDVAQQQAEVVPAGGPSLLWRWQVLCKGAGSSGSTGTCVSKTASIVANVAFKMLAPHMVGDRRAVADQAADAEVVALAGALHEADDSGKAGTRRRELCCQSSMHCSRMLQSKSYHLTSRRTCKKLQTGCKCSGRCTGMPCCRRPHLSPSLGVAKTMRPSCGMWSRRRGCHRLFSHL